MFHTSAPSRIYAYGAKAPTANAEMVFDQVRAGHRYRNTLVELERRRREDFRAAVAAASPELVEVTAQLEVLDTEVKAVTTEMKAVRGRGRQRAVPQELKTRKTVAQTARKAAWTRRKELMLALADNVEYQAVMATQKIENADRHKAARAACGLYWGSYLITEREMEGMRGAKGMPQFRGWRGSGKIAVQIQGGRTLPEILLGRDTRIQIVNVPAGTWGVAGSRASSRRKILRIRVGSVGRAPIWAEIPFVLHRDPPADAKIKWVQVVCRRVATHTRWEVLFVLSRDAGWLPVDRATSGRVSIDLGWRTLPEGLRVATWRGDDGQKGTLVIPTERMAGWKKTEELQSIRDVNFNTARLGLGGWLGRQETLPDWVGEKTAYLSQWRSLARLAGVCIYWRTHRFEGDAEAFDALEAWRKHDKHLYEYQMNLQDKLQAWRKDKYRKFAAEMYRSYRSVILEDMDLGDFDRHTEPEQEEATKQIAARERRIACPHVLRQLVSTSMDVEKVDPANTTQRCHACGNLQGFDAATVLVHTCDHCGVTWCQDDNACLNLLRLSEHETELQTTP